MFSKKNIKVFAVFLISAALFIAFIFIKKRTLSSEYKYSSDFFVMDTVVSIQSMSDVSAGINNIFKDFQSALSCNDKTAETYRLNTDGRITPSDILSGTVRSVLDLNRKYGSLTDITVGRLTLLWNVTAEDPAVPEKSLTEKALSTVGTDKIIFSDKDIILENNTALDFGAVGKGAALDTCLEYLEANGCKKTIVSTGSSVLLYGKDSFDVSIVHPEGNGALAAVNTDMPFLSTSGGYERYFEAEGKTYCHIIDPYTGYPTDTDLTTVTVFCDSGIMSDFLSTMIFLDGSQNINKYLNSDEYKIFAADKNKRLYVSPELEYEVLDEKYEKYSE